MLAKYLEECLQEISTQKEWAATTTTLIIICGSTNMRTRQGHGLIQGHTASHR